MCVESKKNCFFFSLWRACRAYPTFLKKFYTKTVCPSKNNLNYSDENLADFLAKLSVTLLWQRDKVRRHAWSPLLVEYFAPIRSVFPLLVNTRRVAWYRRTIYRRSRATIAPKLLSGSICPLQYHRHGLFSNLIIYGKSWVLKSTKIKDRDPNKSGIWG